MAHELVTQPVDGSAPAQVVGRGNSPSVAAGFLVFSFVEPNGGGGLHYMKLQPDAKLGADVLLQQLPEHETDPSLSPDGKLLAYTQGEVDRAEVILRTFPEPGRRWQVSASGGSYPVWTRKGDAIFYRAFDGSILRVGVRGSPDITLDTPKTVSRPSVLLGRTGFDVSVDGTRLLMVQEIQLDDRATSGVVVANDWFEPFRK